MDTESADYQTVITDDPFCCETEWDATCQAAYDALNPSCTPPPANDECVDAVVLGINADGDCPALGTIGTTVGALQSGAEPSCDSGPHQDVWYVFDSGDHTELDLNFTQGSITISILDIFEGTCAGLVELDCIFSFSDVSTTLGVTPNTTYYVRVSNHADFDTPGDFTICLSAPEFVTVTSSALLHGPLNSGTGLMGDNLRSLGLIPTAQPYSAAPWNFAGTETVDPSVFSVTGNDAIVDWVLLELRDETTPSTVVARRAALIQRDGNIVDTDGVSEVRFDGVPDGDYHLAVRHRNHLGIMAANTYALSQIPTDIDLRTAAEPTYGTDARRVAGSWMAMWGGNANSNANVRWLGAGNDQNAVLAIVGATTPNAIVSNTYHSADVNMNGNVRWLGAGNDQNAILSTVGATTPNAIITQQLP